MHSLGMGFTIDKGVVVTASRDDRSVVLFNGEEIRFPTVVSVIHKLTPLPVRIEAVSPLPLGCGFGLSGATSLATAYALNGLLELGKTEYELGMAAHVAEVENLTGLGDVCAQYRGGCLAKLKEGQPLAADPLPVREQPVYYRYFSPILTREVLKDAEQKDRINRAADKALSELAGLIELDSVDFDLCIELSKRFAMDSGLLRDERVMRAIQQVEDNGGFASMIMLGNAVFSSRPFEGAQEAMLSKQRGRVL